MERIWLQNYPPGVPADIDPEAYPSVNAVLLESCRKFGPKPAFTNLDRTLTFAQVETLSRHFAAYLQQHTDLKPGDRIALQMPNMLSYPVALFGALRAGLIVVNTNPLYTEREMLHQFTDAGCRAIVIIDFFADKLQHILPQTDIRHIIVTHLADLHPWLKRNLVQLVVKHKKKMVPPYHLPQAVPFRRALAMGAKAAFAEHSPQPQHVAVLQYTGGTTGVAKGAMLTHRNLVANLMQNAAWMKPLLKEGQEVVMTPLPMYHIFSFTVNCMTFIQYGGQNILITNPRDLPAFTKEMAKYPFTVLTGVNTLFNGLLNFEPFRKLDLSALKICVAGGMALQLPVSRRWQEVVGKPIHEGYGLTETSPVASCNPLVGLNRDGTIGVPYPSTLFKLVDEQGRDVAPGERGELCIQGPQVMQGYWNRPDETAKTIKNGWLHTGDVALMDPDGYFRIVDRLKDMILVSGFNVYPNEVEEALAEHEGILECAAIGVPDEESGEAVKVFCVRKVPTLTEDDVRAHARQVLTGYKRPKYIEFRDELPKSNVGKILRRMLRD
jgi:long-chain acyl-CoA synthetase